MPQFDSQILVEASLSPWGVPGPRRASRRPAVFPFPLLAALLLVCSGASGSLGATPSDPMQLTRDAAIAMAIRANIDLRAQSLNSAMAQTSLARSRAVYDPYMTASVSTGENTFPGETFRTKNTFGSLGLTQYLPTGGSLSASTQSGYTTAESANSSIPSTRDWQSNVGLTVYHPLLKNFGQENMELSINLAANSLQDSLESFRFFLTDTIFSVITTYNRLYSLRQTLLSRQAALVSAQNLLGELNRRTEPGPQQKIEIANAEYAMAQRRKDLVDAQRNVSDQESRLRYLIGMDEKTHIIPVDAPSSREPEASEREATAAALEHRSDLKQLRLSLVSALMQERVSRRNVLPDLALTASGGYSGIDDNFSDTYQQIGEGEGAWWSAGMQFALPLGNTAAENDYRQSRLRVQQVRHRITAYEWQVRDSIESDMRSLISARLQLQTTEQSLKYAEERFLEYRKQHEAGAGTLQDMLDAERDSISARNSYSDAAENFAYFVALLWRDMGVLLERYDVHFDTTDPAAITGGLDQPMPENLSEPPPAGDEPPATAPPAEEMDSPAEPEAAGPEPAAAASVVVTTSVLEEEFSPAAPATAGSELPAAPAASFGSQPEMRPVETGMVYILRVDGLVTKARLAKVKKSLTEAALIPVVEAGPGQKTEVFRVYYGSYTDKNAAREALSELGKAKAAPFILQGPGGLYKVYAASFFDEAGARREQDLLQARGMKSTLEKASVTLPSYQVTAGCFASEAADDEAAASLARQGLPATVMATPL